MSHSVSSSAASFLTPLELLYCQYTKLLSKVYLHPLYAHHTPHLDDDQARARIAKQRINHRSWFTRDHSDKMRRNPLLLRMLKQHIEAQASILPQEDRDSVYDVSLNEAAGVCDMVDELISTLPYKRQLISAYTSNRTICFSGGLDSVVSALMDMYAIKFPGPIELVHINYRGPYSDKEQPIALEVAEGLCKYADERNVNMQFISVELPDDNWIVEDKLVDGYIIPGRNGWLALTTYLLTGSASIGMTAHYRGEEGQAVGAIDKNFRFFSELTGLLSLASDQRVHVTADTINVSKADTLEWAKQLADFDSKIWPIMDATTSCYHPERFRCGECSACLKRYQAISQAGYPAESYTVNPTESANFLKHSAREQNKGRR